MTSDYNLISNNINNLLIKIIEIIKKEVKNNLPFLLPMIILFLYVYF